MDTVAGVAWPQGEHNAGFTTAEDMLRHDPGHVTAFLIGATAGVVVIVALVVVRSRVQRRIFAGPRLDAWHQARRQLRWADQWRVIWATRWTHTASRAGLAHAQLAYARYFQDAAGRAIEKQSRPGLWKGLPLTSAALLGFSALGWWATAATQSPDSAKVFPYVPGAWFGELLQEEQRQARAGKDAFEATRARAAGRNRQGVREIYVRELRSRGLRIPADAALDAVAERINGNPLPTARLLGEGPVETGRMLHGLVKIFRQSTRGSAEQARARYVPDRKGCHKHLRPLTGRQSLTRRSANPEIRREERHRLPKLTAGSAHGARSYCAIVPGPGGVYRSTTCTPPVGSVCWSWAR